MATGLVVADDDISVGGRVSPGAQLSRVKTYLFTESTDLTVNVARPTGVNFSSSQSIVIPTKGLIVMAFSGELTAAGGGTFTFYMGFNDGVADIWPLYTDNTTVSYGPGAYAPGAGTTDIAYASFGFNLTFSGIARLPIEELGIATGTITVQPIVAANNTNSNTIDGATGGTVTPAQIYMEVRDFT